MNVNLKKKIMFCNILYNKIITKKIKIKITGVLIYEKKKEIMREYKLSVLLIPISRRNWLVFTEPSRHAQSSKQTNKHLDHANTQSQLQLDQPPQPQQHQHQHDEVHPEDNKFNIWVNKNKFTRKVNEKVREKISYAQAEWLEFESAPPNTWKGKVYKFTSRVLLDRINPTESFLKTVSHHRHCSHITIYYPDGSVVDDRIIRRGLRLHLKYTVQASNKMFWLWTAALPFTMTLSVLPGPNVFLAWNAFRCYSLFSAQKGGNYLLQHLTNNPTTTISTSTTIQPRVEFVACEYLGSMLMDNSDDESNGDTTNTNTKNNNVVKLPQNFNLEKAAIDRISEHYNSAFLHTILSRAVAKQQKK